MTRDKVGVGWQHAGGVAGGPKCTSVGCVGGLGHRHQGTATWQRDGGGAGSCEPGAVGTEVRLFRNKVLVCGPGHPPGRAGKPTDSAHVGRVPHALAPIPPPAGPPVRRPAAASGSPAGSRVGAGKLRSQTLGVVVCPGRHQAQAGHCSITSRLPGLSAAASPSNRFHLSSRHECTEPEREERRLSSLPRLLC